MPTILDLIAAKGGDVNEHLKALQSTAPQLLYSQQRIVREKARAAYITQHPQTLDMLRTANMLSSRDEPVLILGPTGTGKELVAKILHADRASKSMPPVEMVTINCSAFPAELFESLVFGHKRGSFTGSVESTDGLLRNAKNSTAFLDEIGDLPLAQQAKLLRVIATNKVRPVGDTEEYPISCRFVFATHRDLKQMMLDGKFREDLYYRISASVLRTFGLSQRQCDIIPIARSILVSLGVNADDADIIDIPVNAYATGNVRQLYNFLYRRFVLSYDTEQALIDL